MVDKSMDREKPKAKMKKNRKKGEKDNHNISSSSSMTSETNTQSVDELSQLTSKITMVSIENLQGETRQNIREIHALTVCMLRVLAEQRGFCDRQHVTLKTKKGNLAALLHLDNKIKHSVAVINDETSSGLIEGEEIFVLNGCPKLFAQEVIMCPDQSQSELCASRSFIKYLKEQMIRKCILISTGAKVIVNYLSQDIVLSVGNIKNFAIKDTKSSNTHSQCIWQTKFSLESHIKGENNDISNQIYFETIGGYKTELNNLREEIEHFFISNASRKSQTKGILITGPSGCGKSLIGKALKTKYGDSCLEIQVDVIKSKYRGETEQNLKKQFEKAANRAPCIIFIDDIDMLCTSRDKGDNSGIITALLHLMDGVSETSSEGVLVVATSSEPQHLDSALRRPGRLSYDVVLSAPDENDRKSIMEKLLVSVPNNLAAEDIQHVAASSPGYVGGDLRSVVLEALIQANGNILQKENIMSALAIIKPAALKTSAVAENQIQLDDIDGYEILKCQLKDSLSLTMNHSHIFQQCGLSPPRRFLFFGPPGCGKSGLILAIAAEFHLNVIPVTRSTVLGKYFGESEQNLAKIFVKAQESSPCILHFENFDGLAGTKSSGDDKGSDLENRIINHLKVQLDGIVRNDKVLIFAETNRPDLLNKDVIRPGRFHEFYHVDLPNPSDRQAVLKRHLSVSQLNSAKLDDLTNKTEGFTVAELIQFIEELKSLAGQDGNGGGTGLELIDIATIEDALDNVVPNTSLKMMKKYQSFAKTYCSHKNEEIK